MARVAAAFVVDPKALRAAREDAGFTKEHVAIEVSRSVQSVEGWEAGRHSPPPQAVAKLADVEQTAHVRDESEDLGFSALAHLTSASAYVALTYTRPIPIGNWEYCAAAVVDSRPPLGAIREADTWALSRLETLSQDRMG